MSVVKDVDLEAMPTSIFLNDDVPEMFPHLYVLKLVNAKYCLQSADLRIISQLAPMGYHHCSLNV